MLKFIVNMVFRNREFSAMRNEFLISVVSFNHKWLVWSVVPLHGSQILVISHHYDINSFPFLSPAWLTRTPFPVSLAYSFPSRKRHLSDATELLDAAGKIEESVCCGGRVRHPLPLPSASLVFFAQCTQNVGLRIETVILQQCVRCHTHWAIVQLISKYSHQVFDILSCSLSVCFFFVCVCVLISETLRI